MKSKAPAGWGKTVPLTLMGTREGDGRAVVKKGRRPSAPSDREESVDRPDGSTHVVLELLAELGIWVWESEASRQP